MFNIFVTVNGTKHSKPTMAFIITKNNFEGTIDVPSLTQNRNFNLPDASGNLVVDSQLSAVALSGSYNDLSNKPSFPATPNAYVTHTWRSGANWYRKWSNGFIEQGGSFTNNSSGYGLNKLIVSFHLHFNSSSYVFLRTDRVKTQNNGISCFVGNWYSKSITSIVLPADNDENYPTLDWYACGY